MECPDCEGKGFKEYDAGLVQIWCKTCESTGKVDCELTKEEFEKAYAFRSDMTPAQVAELGLVAVPSDCTEGWAMQKAAIAKLEVVSISGGVPDGMNVPESLTTTNLSEEAETTLAPADTTTIIIGDTKVNLCDTCKLDYPACDSPNVEYGDGAGNDNIIKCDIYDSIESYVSTHSIVKPADAEAAKEIIRSTRELKPSEYRCSKCSKPGKTVIHMLKKGGDGKDIGHKHYPLEPKV